METVVCMDCCGTPITDTNMPTPLSPLLFEDDLALCKTPSPPPSQPSAPVLPTASSPLPKNEIHRTIIKALLEKDRHLHNDPVEAYFSVGESSDVLGTLRKQKNWDFVKEMTENQVFIKQMALEKYVYLIEHILYPCYCVNKRAARENPSQSHRGLSLYIMIALLNPENLYSYSIDPNELVNYIEHSLESINEILKIVESTEAQKETPQCTPSSVKRSLKELMAIYVARSMSKFEKSYLNKVNKHAARCFSMLQQL